MDISLKVENIIGYSINGKLELVAGENKLSPLIFNQRDILRRINFYLASKYIDRDDDAMFWNLSTHRIIHFSKNIDVDTKDFYPYGEGEINFFQSWALRKMFKEWCRENHFYLTLNDVSEGLATYGSIVWKRYKEKGRIKLKEVKLDNLYFDQAAETIRKTNVVEKHFLSIDELLSKKGSWNDIAISEIIEDNKDASKIEVWEYWGWYLKDEKLEFTHVIGYGFGEKYKNLWEEPAKEDDSPYYDFHLGRYKGRWLRVGVVERLFKLQEEINRLVNYNDEATAISSLLLLRTQDPELGGGNVLEQAVSGQIFTSTDLQQIGIDNRGLNAFIQQMMLIERQADRLCLTPEVVQGEQSPSGTPFRTIAVINSNSKSAFSAYKQNLGEGIAEILINDILPEEVKKFSKKEFVEMEEDDKDVDVFDEALLNRALRNKEKNGELITTDIVDSLRMEIADKVKMTGRRMKLDDKFFDFKWGIKIYPTNDSIDKQASNDAMFNALQIQGSNPANANTPLFRQYLENNGISYWKLTPKQILALEQQNTGSMVQPKRPDKLLAEANKA